MRFFVAALTAVLLHVQSSPPALAQVTGSPADNYVEGSGTITTADTAGLWVPIGRGRFVVDVWGDALNNAWTGAMLERRNRAGGVTSIRGRTLNDGFFAGGGISTHFEEIEALAEYRVRAFPQPSGAPAFTGTLSWRIVQDRR